MFKLACKDMGMEECDFVAMGETKEAMIEAGMAHVKEAHPEKAAEMESMTPEQKADMDAMVDSKMTQE